MNQRDEQDGAVGLVDDEYLANGELENRDTSLLYWTEGRCGGIRLQVCGVTGRAVRTLQDGQQKPGIYTVNWDGRDDRGRQVARGVYFYHLAVPGFEDIKKAVVMR